MDDHAEDHVALALGGFFRGFEGHKSPLDAETDEAINCALISLDANILLGLYRFPDEFVTALIEALTHVSERLFVSRQALTEFWRNRTSALEDRGRAKAEVEGRLEKNERSVSDALKVWAKQSVVDDADLEDTLHLVKRQFEVLRRVVADNHQDDVANYPSPGRDPIVQALETLLVDKVGAGLPGAAFDEAISEGKRRHAAGEPPGFKEKEAEKDHLREGVAGDYLVWRESVDESVRRDMNLLLLTADEKEDWYWRSRDEVIGPRPELAKELWDANGRRLFLLTPIEFMRRYKALGGAVSERALVEAERSAAPIEDAARPSETYARWTVEAVNELLAMLDQEASVQAAVIRAAAANGGSVSREEVFYLGDYGETRMLRGFTRPVRRFSRVLQERGDLSFQVTEMLTPRYDFGVQANAFDIPPEVVGFLQVSASVEVTGGG